MNWKVQHRHDTSSMLCSLLLLSTEHCSLEKRRVQGFGEET